MLVDVTMDSQVSFFEIFDTFPKYPTKNVDRMYRSKDKLLKAQPFGILQNAPTFFSQMEQVVCYYQVFPGAKRCILNIVNDLDHFNDFDFGSLYFLTI